MVEGHDSGSAFVVLQLRADRLDKPFVVPGDPKSGLLPGISNTDTNAPGVFGSGDKRVQAYNFRMFLAKM